MLRLYRLTATFSLVSFCAGAGENKYSRVANLNTVDLNLSVPDTGGALRKDVWFDYDNAVLHKDRVLEIIDATIGRCRSAAPAAPPKVADPASSSKAKPAANLGGLRICAGNTDYAFPGKDDYIIFHVVNWKGSDTSALKMAKQNWYVYNIDSKWDTTAFTGTRIFGKKSVYLYTIHLELPALTDATYEARYAVDEKGKAPAFLDHLLGIGKLFGISAPTAGIQQLNGWWYAWPLDVQFVPADLQITPEIVLVPIASNSAQPAAPPAPGGTSLGPPAPEVPLPGAPAPAKPVAPAKPGAAKPPAAAPPKPAAPKPTPPADVTLDAKTFDNEGKYHIDFSVAVPLTKITQLSYIQTSNSIAPAKIDQQKIFALFDYYPVAVDIKNSIFPKTPYLLTGVAIGSQPLKKALFGIGWGPVYANFYAALLLNTQAAPAGWNCGDKPPAAMAGASLTSRHCPEFNFGLNVAVGAVADALKSKNSSSNSGSSSSAGSKQK
jgi:hypothetical protein